MAAITVVRPGYTGASIGGITSCSAGGDTVENDGSTLLRFTNSNGAARNVTIAPVVSPTATFVTFKTFTINVPATTGDVVVALPPPQYYNNAATSVALSYDAVTNLGVYAISARG